MFPKKSVTNIKNNTIKQTQSRTQTQSQSQSSQPPRPNGPKRCSLCALKNK